MSASLLAESGRRSLAHRAPAVARVAANLRVDADRRATLLFVFQPGDCAAFSGIVDEWNRLHDEGSAQVVGIGVRFTEAERRAWEQAPVPRPSFHVRFDLGDEVEELILEAGHSLTPATILLDRDGRARLLIPPIKDRQDVTRLSRIVRAHLDVMEDAADDE